MRKQRQKQGFARNQPLFSTPAVPHRQGGCKGISRPRLLAQQAEEAMHRV